MTTKIKFIVYFYPLIVFAFLLFCFVGMTIDGTIELYSVGWYVFLLVLILYSLLMWLEYVKIPKIKIGDGSISYRSKAAIVKFKRSAILKLERTKSGKSSSFSTRGGIEIHTKSDKLLLPFHIYSNEKEILQYLYQVNETNIDIESCFDTKNFSFIKYFYRESNGFLLITILLLFAVIISKIDSHWGILGTVCIFILLAKGLLLNYRYLKIEDGYLKHINPLQLKSTKYKIDQIAHSNSQAIRTGKSIIKNLTIELVNKSIVTLRAGLNTQKEIGELAKTLNTKPLKDLKLKETILENAYFNNSSR